MLFSVMDNLFTVFEPQDGSRYVFTCNVIDSKAVKNALGFDPESSVFQLSFAPVTYGLNSIILHKNLNSEKFYYLSYSYFALKALGLNTIPESIYHDWSLKLFYCLTLFVLHRKGEEDIEAEVELRLGKGWQEKALIGMKY